MKQSSVEEHGLLSTQPTDDRGWRCLDIERHQFTRDGVEAIEGYLQSKSVWINNGPGGGNPFVMKTAS